MAAPDPTELGRKIRQHDNEFEALYELVGRVDRKVGALEVQVSALGVQVDALEVQVEAGFERVDVQLTDMNTKLDAILQRLV